MGNIIPFNRGKHMAKQDGSTGYIVHFMQDTEGRIKWEQI